MPLKTNKQTLSASSDPTVTSDPLKAKKWKSEFDFAIAKMQKPDSI